MSQKLVISPKMSAFTTIQPGEEAIDQEKYHYQACPTGTQELDFFGETASSAPGKIRDSNIPKANSLVANPKRYVLQAFGVDVIPGVLPSQKETANAGLNTFINDVWNAISGGAIQLELIDTTVLTLAPLSSAPAGRGMAVAAAAVAFTLGAGANECLSIAYATNGLPHRQCMRWLQAPLPVAAETEVQPQVTFTAPGVTLSATARLGVVCEGLEVRPAVAG